MTLTTARLCAVAAISRDALNKIMDPDRGGLRTAIPPTAPGAARGFTRENGLEVAFIAALGRAGVVSRGARAFAAEWVAKAAAGRLERYWTCNPGAARGLEAAAAHLEYTEPIPYPDLAFMLADGGPGEPRASAAGLVTIDRHELVRRVDACLDSDDSTTISAY
jgi:hypothetical protein